MKGETEEYRPRNKCKYSYRRKEVYRTKKIFNVPMSYFADLKFYHMCGYMGLREGWGQRLVGARQLIFSIGTERKEVYTLALKTTTPRKEF
jgi:hypothetical protein